MREAAEGGSHIPEPAGKAHLFQAIVLDPIAES